MTSATTAQATAFTFDNPAHGRIGRGQAIHLIIPGGHGKAACGAGENMLGTTGRRNTSTFCRPRLTKDPLTCKKCLEIQTKRDEAAQAEAR